MSIDFSKFSKEQLEELQDELSDQLGRRGAPRRVNFDNMTDQERAQFNKTIQPITPMVPWQEYPKVIYGKFEDGSYRQARVQSSQDEEEIKASNPADWRESMMAHGVDLTSRPSKAVQRIQFLGAPLEDSVGVTADLPSVASVPQEHPAAAAQRRRGRPPKNAAA